jgi:hypothetical protein
LEDWSSLRSLLLAKRKYLFSTSSLIRYLQLPLQMQDRVLIRQQTLMSTPKLLWIKIPGLSSAQRSRTRPSDRASLMEP